METHYDTPVIIAIDPSIHSSGVCVLPLYSNTPIAYENICPPIEDPIRLRYQYNRLMAIFSSYLNIKYISFERQIPQMRYNKSSGSILPLAENIGILKLAIINTLQNRDSEISVLAVPPDDIKKYATGNRKATKEDMMAAVNGNHMKSIRKAIPEHSVNDIADAYHLANMTKKIIEDKEDKYLYFCKLSNGNSNQETNSPLGDLVEEVENEEVKG